MIPSLFIAHGSPMIAIEETKYTKFLNELGKQLNPKGIVVFSAHHESEIITVSSSNEPYKIIYDFSGFPKKLYQVTYQVKGSTVLSNQVAELLNQQDIQTQFKTNRGLDHGVWAPLKHLFPNPSVPIVNVSINPYLSIQNQIEIGQAIKTLGQEDILVIGSGGSVHNFAQLKFNTTTIDQWAIDFDNWLIQTILKQDIEELDHYLNKAPHANLAVPTPEHLVPLFIAMGSGNTDTKVLYRDYDYGSLSYLCMQF